MVNIRQPDPADRIELVEQPPSAGKAASVYAQVGGDPPFRRLVETFYAKIERDPVLRPLFPSDLTEGKENQFLFLTQFFGGPPRYTAKRGHPRLRARHLAFPIGRREAETWLGHMLAAIDEVGIPEPARTQMRTYFAYTARFLQNREP